MNTVHDLQDAAEAAVRRTARDHAPQLVDPVDPGNVMIVREAVEAAYRFGRYEVATELGDAFVDALDEEGFNIDQFVDKLAALQKPGSPNVPLIKGEPE